MATQTSDKLREGWNKWNNNCHPDDRIDWNEWLDEHKSKGWKVNKSGWRQ